MQRPPKRTSRGPRRLPRDTQRDTQRWSKTWSKIGQKVHPKISKKDDFYNRKIALTGGCWVGFQAMGPSKNAYFEDVFKMAKKLLKMPKNGPKMIPKWFKIPKLFKIAPKIRPYKDS